MTLDVSRIETITFDSFSTIVDVHTATEKMADYVDDPELYSWIWRTIVRQYRPLCNFIGYKTHHEINREALEYVFGKFDIEANEEDIEEIANVYYEMKPFNDVRGGMERLVDAGYDLYVVSNGDHDVVGSMVENADIGDLLEDTISANEIKVYKPHVRLYKHAAEKTGTPVDNILHAASCWEDVQGGRYAGMQGAWVNRQDDPYGLSPFDSDPELVVKDFHELADALDA